MKKIILFEDLNMINFYFSLLLIPFLKKIYFREATYGKNHFFFKKKLGKIFFQIGLKDLDGSKIIQSYQLKKYLIKKYINNNFQPQIFDEFCKLKKIKTEDKKKLIYSYENYLFLSEYECIDTSSYICVKILFSNNFCYYIPSSEKSYLVMNEIKSRKFKVIGITVLINIFFLIFNKCLKLILSKMSFISKKKNIHKVYMKDSSCNIGYFPHAGLKYGNFFKKNYFYQNFSESPLYKKNIETLSFQKLDKLSLRYLNFFKLKNTDLSGISNQIKWKQIYIYIIFFLKNNKFILRHKTINFKFFLLLHLSINKYNGFFKNKKLKYLFFDNDTLISHSMLLSANINKIKTISFQDRITSHVYYHRCFFDLYMLAGSKFKKIFKNRYFVNDYKVLGLTRANLIKKKKITLIEDIIKKDFSIVACLLTSARTDWGTNIFGEDGSSCGGSLNFCEDIIKLSKFYKNKFFIIKFKTLDSNRTSPVIDYVKKNIHSLDNVILYTGNELTSVNLIAHSDLVIGKHSTVMDEALIVNKDVLIHDSENFISSMGYLKQYESFIVKNFDDLLFKTKEILEKKDVFYQRYSKEKSNFIQDYLTNQGIVGSQKKIVEIVEKYIKNIN